MTALVLAACAEGEPATPADDPLCGVNVTLEFVAAPAENEQEAYICFGFGAEELSNIAVGGLFWTPPDGGPVALHHAVVYATAEDYPDGPIHCGAMPKDAIGLHVWAPGGGPLALPPHIGLELPSTTRRLIVEAHVFRVAQGNAGTARAEICGLANEPEHLAGWLSVEAPVPAMRPHSVESATGRCTATSPFTVISSWPHMHFLGKEFHGAAVRRDGRRVPLIDLTTWDFNAQRTYPLDVQLEPGDGLETTCVWENPTNDYVLPGPFSTDEMCNQGFIAWPKASVQCEPTPLQ